jgi:hypothetical protein
MRKESHSSRCTIFAIRPDTLSSRMDICFIKPQDLLALSKAIWAWRFAKDKRLSRCKIRNTQYIDKKGKEATKLWSQKC